MYPHTAILIVSVSISVSKCDETTYTSEDMANWNVPNVPPRSRRGSEVMNLAYYHPNLKSMEHVSAFISPIVCA